MSMQADFIIDGRPVTHADFVRVACDPQRSVVVEACAGSGKTWLLVSRMLRLLLNGAEPSELLAITFTRKAAQEMRERLLDLLEELALKPEPEVLAMLEQRGLSVSDARRVLPAARGLYQRVLASPFGLSVDTFHSWFARLLQIAPLSSGVPHAYALEDNTSELADASWLRFMQSLNRAEHVSLREALMTVYEIVGNWSGKEMIDAFIRRRAEWLAASQSGDALDSLRALCGDDGVRDARMSLWEDRTLHERFMTLAHLLGQGTPKQQQNAIEIETAITEGFAAFDSASSTQMRIAFDQLYDAFISAKGEPRKLTLTKALTDKLSEEDQRWLAEHWVALADGLILLERRSAEMKVIRLNEAVFTAGAACLEHYQALKAERQVMDFSDLEWLAWKLVTDPVQAAYLQSRLDARYRHVLIDEFQDTNPLQWHIVRSWLDAYGQDAARPTVFIVGDPKQSIYRFRRADPRVFQAARELLTQAGASDLSTYQTRRNALAIVNALNTAMQGNGLYSLQSTHSVAAGNVWRLPLVRDDTEQAAPATGFALRDPLRQFPVELEDVRRRREGHQVGLALHAIRENSQREQALNWSEMMILVRTRTNLVDIERGLREAGVPFVSSRSGGLLDALEVSDLMALLRWLTVSADDHALAQVLKSPIVGCSDDDLIWLATAGQGSWWQRLLNAGDALPGEALKRAVSLFSRWLQWAAQLPVHDLLDQVMHEGELYARYAMTTPSFMRAQVLGNLDAFLALALDLDAGRYPSIARFLDRLKRLQRGREQDAPDEANIDAALDAVRIMTVHGAKGLEAEVVVLMDTNHSDSARDNIGMLCDWPQHAPAPTHLSVFGKTAERGQARDALFAEEEAFRQQENWNLLYVGATRARKLLILSGVHDDKEDNGIKDGSWYQRFSFAEEKLFDAQGPASESDGAEFNLSLFVAPRLPPPSLRIADDEDTAATIEGKLLHSLMERLTASGQWPVAIPAQERLTQWLGCSHDQADIIRHQAQILLSADALSCFFDPAQYDFARNEMELVHEAELLRIDRLVMIGNTVWILDYKRNFLESERKDYLAQMARYRHACKQLFVGKDIRTALITVDGRLWEIGSQENSVSAGGD